MIEIKHRYSGIVIFKNDNIADLSGANLSGANLSGADLSRADLSGANLSRADLSGANLSRADLSGADLSGANLSGADLSRADLSGANLSRADLSGANLSGANLSRADLSGADLSGANLSGANLSGADLSGANLSRANLSGANLSRADLYEANLSRADLSGADLSGAEGINKYSATPLLMLCDQPGAIRAYKLVTAKNTGPYYPEYIYTIGSNYECDNPDTNPNNQCGAGISLATLDWCMKEWKDGYKILIAEFTAADIAAIPTGTDGKFRVRRCMIVGEKDLAEIGLVEKKDNK